MKEENGPSCMKAGKAPAADYYRWHDTRTLKGFGI